MGRLEWIAECVGMLKLRFRLFEVMYVEVAWTSPNLLGESQNMFSAKQRTSFPDRFIFCTLESAPEAIECRRFLSGGRRNGQNIGAVHRYRLQPDINYHYRGRFFQFLRVPHTDSRLWFMSRARSREFWSEVLRCGYANQVPLIELDLFPLPEAMALGKETFSAVGGIINSTHVLLFLSVLSAGRLLISITWSAHPGWVRRTGLLLIWKRHPRRSLKNWFNYSFMKSN